MKKVLILGGTTEANELAARLTQLAGVTVITSLAGRTKAPHCPPGQMRSGGFGGVTGLADYLSNENIDALIDATHPFAERISQNAFEACQQMDCPRVALVRPAWVEKSGDRWINVRDLTEAVVQIESGARVFLTVGRQELAPFLARGDVWFLARVIELPDQVIASHMEIIAARGPFALEDEMALLQERRISCLVAKNSGGEASYAKILAARAANLPVIMIARPPAPAGSHVESVQEAVACLRGILFG